MGPTLAHTTALLQQHLPQLILHSLSAADAAAALADDVAQRLHTAISARGQAVLSVSGGTSPIAFFRALRAQVLDWSRVSVTLCDERCVPSDHPDSNSHLVHQHLLQDRAAAARFVPLYPWVEITTSELPVADVMVLGMGSDGHTASLFPDAPNLAQALDPNNPATCITITLAQPPAAAPYPRISQTLRQLLSSRHIALPLQGSNKLATLCLALRQPSPRYPVSYVLHQSSSPVALWLAE